MWTQNEAQTIPEEKKEDQKAIDAKLIPLIEAVPELKSYLAARFSLKSGVKPHELVFWRTAICDFSGDDLKSVRTHTSLLTYYSSSPDNVMVIFDSFWSFTDCSGSLSPWMIKPLKISNELVTCMKVEVHDKDYHHAASTLSLMPLLLCGRSIIIALDYYFCLFSTASVEIICCGGRLYTGQANSVCSPKQYLFTHS